MTKCRYCGNTVRLKRYCSPECIVMGHIAISESGCWEWTGQLYPKGYGKACVGSKKIKPKYLQAHRLSYRVFKGPLIDGLVIRHRCHNRKCVNPDHLIQGTTKENFEDSVEIGTCSLQNDGMPGERNPNALLTEAKVLVIRQDPRSNAELGHIHGVSAQTIRDIKVRKSWRHI